MHTQTTNAYFNEIIEIAQSLPEWFTPKAVQTITSDLNSKELIISTKNEKVQGFLIYHFNDHEAEIDWLAVRKESQGKGIGKELIQKLVELAKKKKIQSIFTTTLDESINYPPYESTRKFYFSLGFKKEKVVPEYWGSKDTAVFLRLNITNK